MILEALVSNAGKSFQRRFGDEMLLERLRTMATDSATDREVKNRVANMFIGWHEDFKEEPSMAAVAHLKDTLPKKRKAAPVVRPPTPDSEDDANETTQSGSREETPQPRSRGHSRNTSEAGPSNTRSSATTASADSPTSRYKYVEPTAQPKDKSSSLFGSSSSKAKSKKNLPERVSLEKEKPRILQTIAAANQASTNLQNALKHVNKEDSTFLTNPQIVKSHKDCRELRKAVLHYIAGIESEEWVGTLLQTNDGLVSALQLYEQYRIIATAPDSDEEEQRELQRRHVTDVYGVDDKDLPPRKPARPSQSTGAPVARANKPTSVAIPRRQVVESESEEEEEEESDAEVESILSEGDENDPFSNKHEDLALKTPAIEKSQPRW